MKAKPLAAPTVRCKVPKLGIAPNYFNAWRLSAKSTTVGIIQSSKVVVVVNITYARLQKKNLLLNRGATVTTTE